MFRRALFITLVFLFAGVVQSDAYWQSRDSNYNNVGASAPYVGPGDIVSGAIYFHGLRGYNAAFSGNVALICDVATGLVCANATWSAASGLTVPLIGGSSCAAIACNIAEFYDQTGNGIDVSNSTNSQRPILTANCIATTKWCATFTQTSSQNLGLATAGLSSAQPWTFSLVGNSDASGSDGAFCGNQQKIFIAANNGSLGTADFFAGTDTTISLTNSVFHSIQALGDGASSLFYIDGTSNSVNPGTNPFFGSAAALVGTDGFSNFLNGSLTECGAWPSGFSPTQAANMTANQRTYYAF